MSDESREQILDGVYKVTMPDGTHLIVGKEWSTHIHKGDGWANVKIEKTGEHIAGVPDSDE